MYRVCRAGRSVKPTGGITTPAGASNTRGVSPEPEGASAGKLWYAGGVQKCTVATVLRTTVAPLIVAVGILLAACGAPEGVPVHQGTADPGAALRWEGGVPLTGMWEVYPGEALAPRDVAARERRNYLPVPPRDGRYFTSDGRRIITGPITYRVRITGIPRDTSAAVSIPLVSAGMSAWVNGNLVRHVPPHRLETDVIIPVVPDATGDADLVMVVYSSGYSLAGVALAPVRMGSLDALTRQTQGRYLRDGVLIGVLVLMALFHLLLLFAPGREIPHLPFVAFSGAAALHVAMVQGQMVAAMVPGFTAALQLRVIGVAIYPAVMAWFWYLRRMFPWEGRPGPYRFILATSAVWLVVSFLVPPARWLDLFYGYLVVLLFAVVLAALVVGRAVMARRPGAPLVLAGLVVLVVGVVVSLVRSRSVVPAGNAVMGWTLVVMALFNSLAISLRVVEFRISLSNLKDQAQHDGLTGLFNRRTFDTRLAEEWERHHRSHRPLALIMVDVDFFKRYNDTRGHQAGDVVLRRVAEILQGHARRTTDVAARYGGEEFVLILPDTDAAGAYNLATRIAGAVRDAAMPHPATERKVVTVSAGVAVFAPDCLHGSLHHLDGPHLLVEAADRALYRAKEAGRDTVHTGELLAGTDLPGC